MISNDTEIAIELIVEAASLLGWAIMLHPNDDEINIGAITVGNLEFLKTLGGDILEKLPKMH